MDSRYHQVLLAICTYMASFSLPSGEKMIAFQVVGVLSAVVGIGGLAYQAITACQLLFQRRGIRDQRSPSREARTNARVLIVSVVLVTALSPAFSVVTSFGYDLMVKGDNVGYYVVLGLILLIGLGGAFVVTRLTRSFDHEYASYSDLRRDVSDAENRGSLAPHETKAFITALKVLQDEETNRPLWAPNGEMQTKWEDLVDEVAHDAAIDRPHKSISKRITPRDVNQYLRSRKKKLAIPLIFWVLGGICLYISLAPDRPNAWKAVVASSVIWTLVGLFLFGLTLYALARQQVVVKLSELAVERRQRIACQDLMAAYKDTGDQHPLSRSDLFGLAWQRFSAALRTERS